MKNINKTLQNQRGAMFGLDARITLAIFSGLSVLAGYTVTTNLDYITGGALTDELKNVSNAIDGYHHDLKQDIFKTLISPTSKNAVKALFDSEAINPGRFRSRWLGPYVEYSSTNHHKYGEMRLEKRTHKFTETCQSSSRTCYLYLSLKHVPLGTLEKVNDDYDGDIEAAPELEGRVQWDMRTQTGDNDQYQLWFRIGRSIL